MIPTIIPKLRTDLLQTCLGIVIASPHASKDETIRGNVDMAYIRVYGMMLVCDELFEPSPGKY